MKKIITLFIVITAIYSCNSNKSATEISDSNMHAEWGVETITGYDNPPTNLTINLNFHDNSVKGFAGCNKFNGNAVRNNNEIRFPALITTRMTCANADSEVVYLNALNKVRSFDFKKNILKFYDASGKVLITYSKL